MRLSRSLLGGALLGLFSVAAPVRSQTSCAPTTGLDETTFPDNTGGIGSVLAMPAGGGQYVYLMTQYGIARASLSDPAHPGPVVLAQIGHKSLAGDDNGGKLPANPALCDCYQGPKTIDAAEAADGSARMISDFDPRFGGYSAVVASATSGNTLDFGQQVSINAFASGSRVASLYLPSGRFFGYFPYFDSVSSQGVAVVDVTSVNGNPAKGAALNPSTTLAWNPGSGGVVILRSAKIGSQYLLVGSLPSQGKIRIAEVDSSTGLPTETSSISTVGSSQSLSVASVNGRTFIFSAEGASGIRIYEYAGGALTKVSASLPGNFNEVVVTGGAFPLIFGHNIISSSSESYVEVYDSNWITQGGAPRQAAHLRHVGDPEHFLGSGFQAFVSGTHAYVYRLAVPHTNPVPLLHTTSLDISCIAIAPNSPPIASASPTNQSAALRQGAEKATNYYGDKWEFQDNSATPNAAPIDLISWDWSYASPFSASTGWNQVAYGPGTSDVKPAYFPCDPSSGGNLSTGTGCATSLGISGTGPAKSYQVALAAHNLNGWGAPTVLAAIPVVAPKAAIVGFDSASGVLQVLTGQGIADASGSQGNISDVATTFVWMFNPGNVSRTGKVVNPIPANANSFALTITYPGGYTATQSGTIIAVDIVPDFSPTSGSVTATGLTITNKMKIGAVTLTSVEYSWDGGKTYLALPTPNNFTSVNGTATVPPPSSPNQTLSLRYNYAKGGVPTTAVVSHGPFSLTTQLAVSITGSGGPTRQALSFTANVTGGAPPINYSWCFEGCVGGFGKYTSGPATTTHTFANPGAQVVIVNVTDSAGGSGSATKSITISGTGGGGGGGGGGVTANLSGPTTGAVGTALSFSVSASGGTAPYTYSWNCGDNPFGSDAGPQTHSCTYTATGAYNVSVEVDDSSSPRKSVFKSTNVTIGGGGPRKDAPNGSFLVVSGATSNPFNGSYQGQTNVPITLTATETNAASWAWTFGDGTSSSGRSVTVSYSKTGSFTVALTVTGDNTNTVGTNGSSTKVFIDPEQFSGLVVPDASAVVADDGSWKTDVTLTNSGGGPITITPVYRSYDSLVPAPPTTGVDVTTLGYESATKYTIPAGGSWSQADVVGFLGGTGKGDLFFKAEGGIPEVAARVYFVPTDPTLGAYGNAIAAYQVGALGQVGVQQSHALLPQTLLGLRSDDAFRFKAKFFNSSGNAGGFHIEAFDETGAAVPITGGTGGALDISVGSYQAVEISDDALGLNDPTHRYVLKATSSTSGIASVSVIDRVTNDQVRLADDATYPSAEGTNVLTYVPGVSRFDTSVAHWRTSVAILNSATTARGVLVEYIYGPGQTAQYFQAMNPGELVTFNDIAELFPNVPDIAAATGTAGLLRVSYPPDSQTATNPVLVSARAYDDRSTTTGGTAGTALSSFAAADAITVGDAPIVIPGAELDDLFRTNVGFFALDDESTVVKVTAVDQNGNVVGEVPAIPLNGASGPWAQMPVSLIPNIPSEPFSLWIEVLSGGRIGTYAINIDQKSSDTTFIKGTR